MATSPDRGEAPRAFRLYKVGSDGGGTTALRPDEHSIQTALWANDSRGVLIVTGSASDEIPADTLVWLPVDGTPAIGLPITGARALCWGGDL